jgi:hypothetical protein
MIFGLGLPRTGTSSIAIALRKLGFRGKNYCLIHNDKVDDDLLESYNKFDINNSNYLNYKSIYYNSTSSTKYILTTRDRLSWRDSINKFKDISCFEINKLPDVIDYENEVKFFFKKNNALDKLLVINLKRINWVILSEFLKVEIPYDIGNFPHIYSRKIQKKKFN